MGRRTPVASAQATRSRRRHDGAIAAAYAVVLAVLAVAVGAADGSDPEPSAAAPTIVQSTELTGPEGARRVQGHPAGVRH